LAKGAPIDLFGVGTELSTSRDDPALGGVYKLVQLDGQPKMKLSKDKATYPYCKQVWRSYADDGTFLGDTIGVADESDVPGEALLQSVMHAGELIAPLPSLAETQQYARHQIQSLPEIYKALALPKLYPVRYSTELEKRRQGLLHSKIYLKDQRGG
jgi:nicotinate phosphoribosyltransferase